MEVLEEVDSVRAQLLIQVSELVSSAVVCVDVIFAYETALIPLARFSISIKHTLFARQLTHPLMSWIHAPA
jgi:hypothetical protein